jgi:phosphate transport system substrate-binding protein
MSKWADVYQQQKGVAINYQSIGSGAGIKQFSNQTVDFGATDAPLKDSEMKKLSSPAVHIPITAGSIAVSYNLPGVSGLRLTPEVLSGIFLGKIKMWNDKGIAGINPGKRLPARAIVVAHRSDGSGTTYIFTNYLSVVSSTWKGKVGAGKAVDWPAGLGGKGNAGVAGIIRQTPGSIGYVELAYAVQNHLAYAALRNRSGRFVKPSVAATTAAAQSAAGALRRDVRAPIVNSSGAGAYPIAGFTYILIYKNKPASAKRTALLNFLRWANTQGQSYATAKMYAPLPSGVARINAAR